MTSVSFASGFLSLLGMLVCGLAFGAESVTLAWNPNSETDLAGYRLYMGRKSGVYSNKVDVGNVTTNTVSGLVSGAPYFFVVTAYNTSGMESDFSNEIMHIPGVTNVPIFLRYKVVKDFPLGTNVLFRGPAFGLSVP